MTTYVKSQKQVRHERSLNWLLAGPLPIKDLFDIINEYMNGIEGNCILKRKESGRFITGFAVLPNNIILAGSFNQKTFAWDAISGSNLAIFGKISERPRKFVVLPDGRLATDSRSNAVCIWDVGCQKRVQILVGHKYLISSLAAMPDQKLISCSCDNTICMWNYDSGECLIKLASLADTLISLFNSDSLPIFPDFSVLLNEKGEKGVRTLAYLPDDKLVLDFHEYIYIWDIINGKCLQTFIGHKNIITALVVMPNNLLASSSLDETIRIWDIESGKCLLVIHHPSSAMALTILPDGKLVSGCNNGIIYMWD